MTTTGFQGFGRWAGTAEVFSGDGAFLGNGADSRLVRKLEDGRTRIDVSFVGPFKHSGHYFISDQGDHRIYQGPCNVGYAETLAPGLVDANAYWPDLGMSQRFFLMNLPGAQIQLSLALMSRGERLLYVVVGQNDRVPDAGPAPAPSLVSGSSHDFAGDPTAGRQCLLLHRPGIWTGALSAIGPDRADLGPLAVEETVGADLTMTTSGSRFDPHPRAWTMRSNGWEAYTLSSAAVAGSYSLSGGRALSGHFHHLESGLRVWRREVVAHDGAQKAVVRLWYRGSARVGAEFGVLRFSADTGDR